MSVAQPPCMVPTMNSPHYAADGVHERARELRAESAFEQFGVDFGKVLFACRNAPVCAQYARTRKLLFGKPAHLFHVFALPRERDAVALGYRGGYERGNGSEEHDESRHRPVHDVHAHYCHDQRDYSRRKLHDSLIQSVRKVFAERGQTGHKIPSAVPFDDGEGNGEQFPEQLRADVAHRKERESAQKNIARPDGDSARRDAGGDDDAVARDHGEVRRAEQRVVYRLARKNGSEQGERGAADDEYHAGEEAPLVPEREGKDAAYDGEVRFFIAFHFTPPSACALPPFPPRSSERGVIPARLR